MNNSMNNYESRLLAEINNREEIESQIYSLKARLDSMTASSSTYPLGPQPTAIPATTMNIASQQQVSNFTEDTPAATQVDVQKLIGNLISLEQRFNSSQHNLQCLMNDFNEMRRELQFIKYTMNEDQQYPRRWNLLMLFDDVPVAPAKRSPDFTKTFTDYVVTKLNDLFPGLANKIVHSDIDNTHIYRTRKFDAKSSKQMVIVRFVSMLRRDEVFCLKKTLKDTAVVVYEHLTKANLLLLKEAQKILGDKRKAWTHYGKVLIELNGYIKTIRSSDELLYYTSKHHNMPPKQDFRYQRGEFPHFNPNTAAKSFSKGSATIDNTTSVPSTKSPDLNTHNPEAQSPKPA